MTKKTESKKEEGLSKEEKLKRLRENIDEEETNKVVKAQKLIATRDKLERDFKEDVLQVTFKTSSQTERTIEARKPTNKEQTDIMTLAAKSMKAEGSTNPEDLEELSEVNKRLAHLAASLSLDKELDEEFWDEYVSSEILSNFITSLIITVQQSSGVTPKEMEKFR
jgi:siderophore synthetase component